MKILILVRRYRSNQSEADEHDFNYNKKTLKNLQDTYKHDIRYDKNENYKKYLNWNPNFIIFLGFDETVIQIKNEFKSSKFAIWAKCYSSSTNSIYKSFYNSLDLIFDSCYLNIFKEKKNYFYLPTAIHKNYDYSFFKKLLFKLIKNKLENQTSKVDLLFSGSPRFNRSDDYRQKLISLLIKKDVKVLLCSPKKLWKKSNFEIDSRFEHNLSFSKNNYWATKEMYYSSKFVLDLPWLDTVIPELEKNLDPQFALGWNIFRAGFHGSNILTYDCNMNRDIGLNEKNCNFYKSNINDLNILADEIKYKIQKIDKNEIEYLKKNIKILFEDKHTYFQRWKFIINKIDKQ